MIGIYKITNKNNGKSYIGQSVHCGKRLDEHCAGKQFIDEVIQVEGIENFSFEILKTVKKEDLSFWEDYFIMKYDTMFPKGYNKRWNCNEKDRERIQKMVKDELELNQSIDGELASKKINFVVSEDKLREMAYGDSVYAWLLLRSRYDKAEGYNYIYGSSINYSQIGRDIHRTRQTVSKKFNALLNSSNSAGHPLIYYIKSCDAYVLPCFLDFEQLNAETVLNLFWMCGQGHTSRKEELIKTYAWLKKQFKIGNKNISYEDLIKTFGHSRGNLQTYDRYKDILTILQDAGLVKFRTDFDSYRNQKGQFAKTFYIYQVNNKVSQEWIDKKKKI